MRPWLCSLTAVHAAGKATFLHVAVQFQVLKLKLAFIPDLSVVRGVAPAVPTHAGEQVLVWYTAVVGGTRGWKLVPFPNGLNEEFTVFAHKCTFPAHVSQREGDVSESTATPPSLPSPPLPSPPLPSLPLLSPLAPAFSFPFPSRSTTVARRATLCSRAVVFLRPLCCLTLPTSTRRCHW